MSGDPKKILYLCADSGIPLRGTKGASIHIREMVAALRRDGIRVTIITNIGEEETPPESSTETIGLPDVDADPFVAMINDTGDDEKAKTELIEFYRNLAVEDLLSELSQKEPFHYIYERYSLFSVAGLRFARRRKIPFILEVNSPLIAEAARYRRLYLERMAGDIERFLFRGADHIVAVSEELKGYISGISPDTPITVVPNGVRVEHFQNQSDSAESEALPLDTHDSGLVVGFAGSLKPWHGVEDLVDTFADSPEISGDGKLLIIGGKRQDVRRLAKRCRGKSLKDRVVFAGAVPYENMPALLRRADVLVAPYPDLPDFYFSPLKIFEYMAAGKAIIVSAIGQIRTVLTHEKTALLIRPGNKDDLREALIRIKREPGLKERLGRNALAEVRSKHTWRQRAEMLRDILKNTGDNSEIKSGSGYAD